MSKKDEKNLKALAEAMKKMKPEDKKYLVGVADGLAMAATKDGKK